MYRLHLKPDNSVRVDVDMEKIYEGSLKDLSELLARRLESKSSLMNANFTWAPLFKHPVKRSIAVCLLVSCKYHGRRFAAHEEHVPLNAFSGIRHPVNQSRNTYTVLLCVAIATAFFFFSDMCP